MQGDKNVKEKCHNILEYYGIFHLHLRPLAFLFEIVDAVLNVVSAALMCSQRSAMFCSIVAMYFYESSIFSYV
jgi:hypothetical protein